MIVFRAVKSSFVRGANSAGSSEFLLGIAHIGARSLTGFCAFCTIVLLFMPWRSGWAADGKPAPGTACRGQLSVLEQDAEKLTLRVRASCPLTRAQLQSALTEVRGGAFAEGARPRILNLQLGRIVEHPWLSTALARAALNSREWDRVKGKPRQRQINEFTSTLLRVGGGLSDLLPGWTLQAVSTEKVLVQPAQSMPSLAAARGDKSLVPYDAQLWLRYASDAPVPGTLPVPSPTVVPPARLEE